MSSIYESGFSGGLGSNPQQSTNFQSGNPKYPSKLPLVGSILSIILSVAIYLIFPHDQLLPSVIGYLLTPLACIIALSLAQINDVMGRRDVWYSPSSQIMRFIKIFAGLSFIFGFLHMWNIATSIASSVS